MAVTSPASKLLCYSKTWTKAMTGAGQMAGSMVKGWLSKGVLKPTQVDMIIAVSDIAIVILNGIGLSTPPLYQNINQSFDRCWPVYLYKTQLC